MGFAKNFMVDSRIYYNNNSQAFYERTINANMLNQYEHFLPHLPEKAHILDVGCGVGRDTNYFLSKGHNVTAFDGSEAMVALASKETGLPIELLDFEDMDYVNEFDGAWAAASLLHVPYSQQRAMFFRINQALKKDGILFCSYKYGPELMASDERYFYNMTEDTIQHYLDVFFDIIEIWQTDDNTSKVAPSPYKKWLNIVARKIEP
jgi:SAM-dependent methyltransferase